MQTISPFLWFNNQAEEAAQFYVSIFPNSRINSVNRLENTPGPEGEVMTVNFVLDGFEMQALNGGPAHFSFNESISLFVRTETQEKIDDLWEQLTADGGEPGQCGWLKDKYGLSWQIVPSVLDELLNDPDPERAKRAMEAMLRMSKLDIAELRAAADAAIAP
jgi:predicted 3-demethylubiquinone-9 3-methyltransferase (glyoxalase superfamily)